MANPLKGEVEVKLGDETKTIRYTMNALCELEAMLGKPVLWFFDKHHTAERLGFRELRAFMYAGLKAKGGPTSPWTLDGVGVAMEVWQFRDYIAAVQQAIGLALGMKKEAADNAAPDPTVPAVTRPEATSTTSA